MTLGEEKQRALHSRRVTPRDQWKTKPIRSFRPYRVSLFLDAQLFWYGKHTRGSAMKPSPGCGMSSFFVVPPLPCSIFWNDLMHLGCSKRFPFHQFFMPCPVAVPIPNPLWAGFMHKEAIQTTLPLRVFWRQIEQGWTSLTNNIVTKRHRWSNLSTHCTTWAICGSKSAQERRGANGFSKWLPHKTVHY